MNIRQLRIASLLLAVTITTWGSIDFCWYIAAMLCSLEILNRQSVYLQHRYKLYNFISWAYSLVLLERLRTTHFSATTEWMINCAEHLFFGIIICIKVYIYTAVFTKHTKHTRWNRALISFLLFNIIGLFNEVFQNSLGNRSLFVFIPDSIKDIQMNFTGAVVFMLAVLCRICFKYWYPEY